MRKILMIGFLLLGVMSRAAEVSLSSVSGHPGEEVTVTLAISNPGSATAMEVDIPIPDGLTFVSGSATRLTETQHLVAGDMKNGELRLIMHSLALETLPSGNLLNFRLKVGKQPGNFALTPKVILSDSNGAEIECTATTGTVTNLTPFIELAQATIDFGRQPIRGTYTRDFTVRNTGTEPLIISGIETSAAEFSVTEAFPVTIPVNGTRNFTVSYSPVNRNPGVAETLTVMSDAVNGNAKLNLTAIPFSVNELHVAESLSGNSDQTVTVNLRLNNMEPITGMEVDFNLPSQLVFVPGTLRGVGRAENFNVTTSYTEGKLKLLAYSLSGNGMEEGDEVVLSFDIRLDGRSGSYYLNPASVILSNKEMENMTSAISGQYVRINSPSISTSSSLSFGNVAVGSEGLANLSVYNSGQAPLTIERIEFTDDIFSLTESLPVDIASYATKSLQFKVAPVREGKQVTIANIYSNDPENRLKTVALDVDAYESNQLTLSGEPNDDYSAYTLHVSLDNFTEITAMQMDIRWIEGMTTSQADMKLSARCPDHAVSVAPMGNGVYRIIIFSLTNTPFTGNEGELFALTYHGRNFTGTTLSAENIVLSSASGENYTSPGSSINVIPVEDVRVSQIQLSKGDVELEVTQTEQLIATILPTNAAIKTVTWTSTNPSVATVSDTGVITAISVGDAIIIATADDDSGVKAVCNVKVIPTPAHSVKISAEGETTLMATETVQLTATVLPENTTDKSVYWSSDDIPIASVTQEGLVTAVSVGEAIITATNSAGQTDQITITVVPTPVSSITLNLNEATLKATQTITLVHTILPETATNKTVEWTTSDESIASVNQEGVVTANAVGNATITVSSTDGSDRSAVCEVSVIPTLAESIGVTAQGETSLMVTQSVQLTATVLPETTTDKSVTWQSSVPEVASVDGTGLVTAISVGEATITATNSAGQSADITITVIPTPAQSVKITAEGETTLKATETVQLKATVLPETATDKSVTWKSDKEDVASVSNDGLVTAISVGEAIITATNSAGQTDQITITVVPTPVSSITLNLVEATLKATQTITLIPGILPETATNKTVKWTTSDESIASVNQEGVVTANAIGNATITVSSTDGSDKSAVCEVNVIPTLAESITVTAEGETSLMVTQTVQLTATVLPATTTDKTVTWQSSAPEVASVDRVGIVTALALGEATITATNSAGQSADITITVIPTPAQSVKITTEGETTLKAMETVQLKATVLPETTTDKSVTWKSDKEEVASVTNDGLVTAVSVGEAIITATNSAGRTDQITITVVPTPVSSITLSRNSAAIKVEDTIKLVPTVLPATATNKAVEWTSSASNIVSVDDEGTIKGLELGTSIITCKALDGSGVSAICEVTVGETAAESISVTAKGETSLMVTQSVQLIATILPATTTDKTITWQSSAPEVASVDGEGLVTALSIGEATITATNSAGQSADITITVVPTPAQSVKITAEGETTLKANETVQLKASVLPETTTDKSVTWKSDKEEVASVTNDGLVTAISVGEAVITATNSAEQTDQLTITVVPTPVSSITLNLNEATLKATQTITLIPVILPETATNKTMKWTTSNEAVATVNQEGVVTAIAVGKATISVNSTDGSDKSAVCEVNVIPTLAESITVTAEGETTLKATETVQLKATVLPETTTDKSVTWQSDKEEVASVSNDGLVSAISVGEAIITATNSAGQSATITITVIPTPAQSVKITAEGETTLKATQTVQLKATVLPETTTDKSVTWQSNKEDVASVSNDGLVTAISVGEAIITATNSEGQTDQITIQVISTPVESISLNITQMYLKVTDEVKLTATVSPSTATNKAVKWESSDTDIVTVDSDGTVKGVLEGQATIRCISLDDETVSAKCEVTVIETPAESIEISAVGETTLKVTETLQLSALVLPETTTNKTVGWSTSDSKIATVDNTGLVTALSEGEAVITATNSAGQTDQITITVVPTPVETIVLSQTQATLRVGEKLTLTAEIRPETATDKKLVWVSSDETVASVSEGTVIALTLGKATVTAMAEGGEGATASCEVNVEATPVEEISIIPEGDTTLEKGETLQLVAVISPDSATDKTVFWQSEKPEIAEVDETGLVTAIAAGETYIFASTAEGLQDRILITVTGEEEDDNGIGDIFTDGATSVNVYDLNGIIVRKNASREDVKDLAPGVYIIGRQKYKLP